MKKARFAIGGRVGWLAGLAVLVASLMFVGEAAAQPVYGIATGKQCAGPINVGDAYVCVASISNTNSTSLGTVTTNLVVDQVFHPDGTTAGAPQTVAINSSTVFPAGPVHLIDDGIAPAPSCDATKCTIPFGDEITVGLSHYTAQLQDVGSSLLGQNTLSDIANFSYRQVCDKPVAGFPCSTALNISGSGAATDVNPVPTTTATAIHDNAGGIVTSVAAGTTVHDFVTVTGPANQPAPTGTVDVQWFIDGACTQPFTSHKIETLVPGAGGVSTVDATDFPQGPLAAGHYSFQANYLGDGNNPSAFTPSQGACEPLTVVDAFIQITPQNATNPIGTTHVLTITVNAVGGGVLASGTATASILTPPSTTGSFVGSPTCNYTGGAATASCTVTITSAVAGTTTVQATSNIGFTNAIGAVTRTTGSAANALAGCTANCGNANKSWLVPADAFIQITPQNANNPAGTNHVLTITVTATGGGILAAGTATASIVTPPSTTGSFVGSPSCNYAGGAATASCTVTITSAVSGLTQVQATSNIGFTNAAGTVTRTTGTAANVTAGCTANCANATKNWADATVVTHVRDAAGNDVTNSNTVAAGTVVHDEATVTRTAATPAAVPNPTGTVTFTLYSSLTCTGTVLATDPNKTLNGSGLATSVTFTTPAAGSFSYLAHYNGDANYPARNAGCEPFAVPGSGGGQITNTCVACSDFLDGTWAKWVYSSIQYLTFKGNINGISPGQFFYWTTVTTTVPNQVVTVSQSNDSTNNAALFQLGNNFRIYSGGCSSYKSGTVNAAGTGGSFTVASPGTYIIGARYDTNTMNGTPAPVPATVTYTFTTSLGGSATVKLTPK